MTEVAVLIHPSGRSVILPRCPHCGATHSHGRGDGLRIAHCLGNQGLGYSLVEGRQLTWKELDKMKFFKPKRGTQ